MRQGQSQQNKNRPRGRGGRNKGGNQSSRNMESNGPDVRIRGTAAHIAEKYTTLSRDALSSGDLVAAENYLQHAEHYNRLIAVAQAAQVAQNVQRETIRNENTSRNENPRRSSGIDDDNAQPQRRNDSDVGATNEAVINSNGPQPIFDEMPAEVALKQQPSNGSDEGENEDTGTASDVDASPAEAPRRKRRAPRKPRKEAVASTDSKSTDGPDDVKQGLPAFIVGATDG